MPLWLSTSSHQFQIYVNTATVARELLRLEFLGYINEDSIGCWLLFDKICITTLCYSCKFDIWPF